MITDRPSKQFISEFKKIMICRYGHDKGNQKIKEAKKVDYDFDFCTKLIDE